MATKFILVLALLAVIAQLTIASPAGPVLQTETIQTGFQRLIGEIAGGNAVLGCVPCQPIGACAGRCCNSPPYSFCINTGNQCYCG